MTTKFLYKIQSKSKPDMFLKGTPYYHSYDKTGRIFSSLRALRTFLTTVMNTRRSADLDDWKIVELEMTVKDIREVHEVIKPEKLVTLLKRQNDY